MLKKVLAWAQKNERHLGAVVFLGGFVTDLLTFTLLDISLVNIVFASYLAVAAACIFGTHLLFRKEGEKGSMVRRTLLVVLPLVAQYVIGNLLSGFLIFYTKSSVLAVSWPFLLLLALVFFGNEWFRTYRDRLAFLTVLLFFSTYAYVIFALPLLLNTLGPWVFMGSTAIALILCALFLLALWYTGRTRVMESMVPIVGSSLAVVLVMVTSYFTGLIPPIPLTLKEGGVYHALSREGSRYVVMAEQAAPWWQITPPVAHLSDGATLYAFTSVFAPVRFSTAVVHRWERYDEIKHAWKTESMVAFPLAGGREGGYRGYSEKTNLTPGTWRISVETPSGQVIGHIPFVVARATTPVELHEETH